MPENSLGSVSARFRVWFADCKTRSKMSGGAVWTSFALDTETGDLHVAVTNPAPDLPVHLRQGTNLYTNSMIVLDARTGKLRWYRQMVPNDSHDWDLTHATDVSPAGQQNIQGNARFESGQGRAQTEVDAASEAQVPIRLTLDIELIGIGELGLITIRRGDPGKE